MRFELRLTLAAAAGEGRRAVDAHVEVDLLGRAAAERAVTFVTQARPATGSGAPLHRPAMLSTGARSV